MKLLQFFDIRNSKSFWQYTYYFYSTKKNSRPYFIALKDFLTFLFVEIGTKEARYRLINATFIDAFEYIRWGKNQSGRLGKRSEQTQNLYLNILKATYNFWLKQNWVKQNIFSEIKSKGSRHGVEFSLEALTAEEVNSLINFFPKNKKQRRDKVIIVLLFACGLRRSEIANLTLKSIKSSILGHLYLELLNTKTKLDSFVYVPRWAEDVIKNYKQERINQGAKDQDFLFLNHSNKKLSDRGVARALIKRSKEVGLSKRVSGHTGRVTAITHLLKNKVDLLSIQKFSRHTTLASLSSYDRRFADETNHASFKLFYEN